VKPGNLLTDPVKVEVTVTGTVPVAAAAGLVQTSWVPPGLGEIPVAGLVPKKTERPPVKPDPKKVTSDCPARGPSVGEMELMVGSGL
jgi:hypothetical protein